MMLHLPELHEDDIHSVVFNPAGTLLITGSEDWGCAIVSWSSLASLDHRPGVSWPVWPVMLPPDHPARCPSLRQCASLRAKAEARAAAFLSPRVAACLVHQKIKISIKISSGISMRAYTRTSEISLGEL